MSYNLHRTGNKAQWSDISKAERNVWQKAAAWSHGIATLANLVTSLGVGMVYKGLDDFQNGNQIKGIAEIVVGHVCDAGDGAVAELTETKSPLGELADAVADKVKTTAELVSLTRSGDIPTFSAGVIATHGLAMALLTGVARVRGVRTHTSLPGKLATGSAAAAITGYMSSAAAQEFENPGDITPLRWAGHFAVGLTAVNGSAGILAMAKDAFAPRTAENSL
jgi:phosphatidylglycerophosphate synthase